jgi:hypothetical protein
MKPNFIQETPIREKALQEGGHYEQRGREEGKS